MRSGEAKGLSALNLQLTASPRRVAQGHDQSATLSQHTAELALPKHNPLHRDLLRYAKLMEWLKNTHREKYEGLSRVGGVTGITCDNNLSCLSAETRRQMSFVLFSSSSDVRRLHEQVVRTRNQRLL